MEGVVPGEDLRKFKHRRGKKAFEVEVLMGRVLRIGRRLRAANVALKAKMIAEGIAEMDA